MIEAYITNLGKYNEGSLCGEWLKLPSTEEEVQALLSRIGVDGVLYEEIFITDYETDISGLSKCLGEYESVDELCYLASLLEDLDDWEMKTFEAALELGDDTNSVKSLINLSQNLDCYDLYSDVDNEEELGRYLIEEMNCLDIPDEIENYFDYEAYGRDYAISEGGIFADNGYIIRGYGGFTEYYSGRDDLPDECRIFAYPDPPSRMSVKEQLKMYGSMAQAQTSADKPALVREDR